ncbi:Ppx/GppA family phosphatase [Aerococcus kribbianus]|uniref:Ppx/GppA family phosphatase n=1 Tax=Aerococcus kribbianus TaxID=2999064 RepID=A0A9X3FLJ0_9LACT|nr:MULTISPECIES: Ppx/GppA family phosphatase [unclassified Aerococcus]MCZ0716727.1 Ppx/GppA family phosphatase [Aerococcus sp. YH-aer221]MCZ0725015.1 Ppx/GppA family phosphatase [Aerococcus sp. YH-aer222]
MKERIGLIDIGSNSIRLVVFQIENNLSFKEIQNIKMPARIYQYIDDDNVMSQEGIDVLVHVMKAFAKESEILKADCIIPKATAAIRQSKNQQEILQAVKVATDISIDIVPEEMEAFYGFNAIIHSMAYRDGVSVDIGGGSTEITYFKDKKIVASHSFDFGAVSLTEKFFKKGDNTDKKALEKTREFVRKAFKDNDFMKGVDLPVIAIGGSARNVARVHQMENDYTLAGLHNYEMSLEDVDQVFDLFSSTSVKDLKKLDGLSSERADIITPAVIVFQELLAIVEAPNFIFSQRGLREGILYEYMENKYPDAFDIDHVANQTVERLTGAYNFSMSDGAQRMMNAKKVYNALHEAGYLDYNEHELELLAFGAYLYYIGDIIEPGNASQHTYYMLSNSNLNGFTHKERVALSILASYKNRTLFKDYLHNFGDWFSDKNSDLLQAMGGLIKFSECLNDSHSNIVKTIDIVKKNDQLILRIFYTGTLISEIHRSESQKKHVERIIDEDITVEFINQASYKQII